MRIVSFPFNRLAVALLFGILLLTYIPAQDNRVTYIQVLNALVQMNKPGAEKAAIIARLLTKIANQKVGFILTKEKEEDLRNEGATEEILAAIRANSPPLPKPTPTRTPIPTPTPPDFSFYFNRADSSFGKGSFVEALTDYDKVIEMKGDNAVAYLNRGRTHYSLDSMDKALEDYERSIALDPKQSTAYYHRGVLREKKGNRDGAIADYQKAADLDPGNEAAKLGVKRIRDEMAKAVEPEPKSISLGQLSGAVIERCKPIYPEPARRANAFGIVNVNVEIDVNGNILSARAVSGHAFLRGAAEDAARRCKVPPGRWHGKPIPATASIQYRFLPIR